MAIKVEPCNDADFYRIFCIISEAFGNDQSYHNLIYPNHHEKTGRIQGAERLLQMKRNDSTNRFMKAIDTDTGEIIGQAKWIVFADEEPAQPTIAGDFWDTEDEKERAAYMYAAFHEPRRKAAEAADRPLVSLDILTVDPKHQRRGAGTELVKWGVRMADEMGAEMCVEATVFGRHLYEKHGFRITENVVLTVPHKWTDKPRVEFAFMQRPAGCKPAELNSKTIDSREGF